MKRFAFLLLSLSAIIFIITGCKKDEEETRKNAVTYNGTEYDLSFGTLENFGKDPLDPAYNLDLTIYSSGFTLPAGTSNIDLLTGSGQIIYFELYTSGSTALDSREYVFDASASGNNGTFDYSILGINFDSSSYDGDLHEITNGKITVVKNGEEYEITIDCKEASGKTITGFFKGKLLYFN
jgi:hypothetical protein